MTTCSPPPFSSYDPDQLAALLMRLRPRLKKILIRDRVPVQDAEDIVQEVILAAIRKWDSILDPEAWVIGTLKNKCSLYWKRQRSNPLQAVDEPLLEALSEPQQPPQMRAELLWDIETMAKELGGDHWLVLRLRYILGMTTPEIALRIGYGDNRVRQLSCRSVARLQKRIAASPVPSD